LREVGRQAIYDGQNVNGARHHMKVTQVSIRPTDAAIQAGAPALTPELLAATGARYSRNNEGLEDILAKIDPENPDKSVDSIFRMVDYGHQSIADMVPVAMFLDGVSQWLAYFVWSVCQAAGGQESSTRYILMVDDALIDADELGIPGAQQQEWQAQMGTCLDAYNKALDAWTRLGDMKPEATRIPAELLADDSEKTQKKVARLRRNYAFDRARYYLPFALATNVMLIMSARSWAQLCQHLCSHALPEARALGDSIREQLALCAPRLMRHATRKDSMVAGLKDAFDMLKDEAAGGLNGYLSPDATETAHPPIARMDVSALNGSSEEQFIRDLGNHDNRYAWIGDSLKRTAVRFSWDAVALAEIRDLNRHRTGNRFCPLRPVGFYSALDEIPADCDDAADTIACLRGLNQHGHHATARAHEQLAQGDPAFVYWMPMGAQCLFEHLTTADKFIYEGELRTGVGAHYRYAQHLSDALALWYERYPGTRELILEGSAEPE
jgi:thymidylate synthase ThyX